MEQTILESKVRKYAKFRQKNNDGCAFYKLASDIVGMDVNEWLRDY